MYGSTPQPSDSDRTAFRKAEKKYKLYKTTAPKSRRKQPSEVDLTEVYDFKSVLESFKQERKNPPGISELRCGLDRPVFCFEDRPGFYFIPGALSIEEQCHWVRESLTSFPQPSNRTNHNAIYGPIHDLFDAVQNKKVLVEVGSRIADAELGVHSSEGNLDACRWKFCEENVSIPKGDSCNSIAASVLLRKLRWSTPWITIRLVQGDMLGGHLDDMEADWSKPIVSISLGCKAIFLLGGKSREDTPVAMFLRSGDIVLMAGQARECFHGIPRIFTDEENAEVSPLASQFSSHEDLCFKEYIRTSRININIRQVH